MNVLFVDPKNGAFINVMDAKSDKSFHVEILAPTAEPAMKLKDKQVTLVCTEVRSTWPEFELDAQYFAKAVKPKRGVKLAIKEGKTAEVKQTLKSLFSGQTKVKKDAPKADEIFHPENFDLIAWEYISR